MDYAQAKLSTAILRRQQVEEGYILLRSAMPGSLPESAIKAAGYELAMAASQVAELQALLQLVQRVDEKKLSISISI